MTNPTNTPYTPPVAYVTSYVYGSVNDTTAFSSVAEAEAYYAEVSAESDHPTQAELDAWTHVLKVM